jgi:hypothetical protein
MTNGQRGGCAGQVDDLTAVKDELGMCAAKTIGDLMDAWTAVMEFGRAIKVVIKRSGTSYETEIRVSGMCYRQCSNAATAMRASATHFTQAGAPEAERKVRMTEQEQEPPSEYVTFFPKTDRHRRTKTPRLAKYLNITLLCLPLRFQL